MLSRGCAGCDRIDREVARLRDVESLGVDLATSLRFMDIEIHHSFPPHTDPEATLRFYRDDGRRWIAEMMANGTHLIRSNESIA